MASYSPAKRPGVRAAVDVDDQVGGRHRAELRAQAGGLRREGARRKPEARQRARQAAELGVALLEAEVAVPVRGA